MPQKISWVLLDMGSTLVNDDPAMLMFYRLMYDRIGRENPSYSFADLMREREQLVRTPGETRPWATLAVNELGRDGWHALLDAFYAEIDARYELYNPPIPGVTEMLTTLSQRYKIAMAANQGSGCRAALKRLGWLEYFDLLWISDEVRARKPEERFFTSLLEKAACRPEEAVMIGDRIDADIRPAKSLGIRTIWARVSPGLPETLDSLEGQLYRQSLIRARVGGREPVDDSETPDAVVTSLDEIPAAVERLQM